MLCAKFEVLKCQVCVQQGDTLLSIARHYQTDWLQLWGANVHISNPLNLVANPGFFCLPSAFFSLGVSPMGCLRLVGSLKLWVSFAEYSLFYRALVQKRPIILRSLLIVANPCLWESPPLLALYRRRLA